MGERHTRGTSTRAEGAASSDGRPLHSLRECVSMTQLLLALLAGAPSSLYAAGPSGPPQSVRDSTSVDAGPVEGSSGSSSPEDLVGDRDAWARRVAALQPQRDEPAALAELERLLAAGRQKWPQDFEVLLSVAGHKVWLSDGTFDLPLKSRLGKEAWDLATQVLALRPDSPVASWYAARGVGAYMTNVPIPQILTRGLQGEFNRHLDAAVEKGSALDFGGPLIARARYFLRLPWPMRDRPKAITWVRRAAAEHPVSLRARYVLAEALHESGDDAGARKELHAIANGDIKYDPPEGRRIQAWARRLAQQLDASR
jgi:hypothetical protein